MTTPGVVIDFWAPWCGPCIKFKPEFHKLAEEYGTDKIRFLAVNTQEATEIAQAYSIKSIPTFYFYKNADLYANFSGANREKVLSNILVLVNEFGGA